MKTSYTIKKEFLMSEVEMTNFQSLPNNLPDNKLTKKQIQFVSELYYKYISKTIDNQAWGRSMYEVEKAEKWPSGPRVKEHEAKRFILSNLLEMNKYRKEMNLEDAASYFKSALTMRPMYAKLIYNVFE